MNTDDRREVVFIAALAAAVLLIVLSQLLINGSNEFVRGVLVGLPIGGALGWATDALLRCFVDHMNKRRRGRQ